jgi:predicted nucleotidyltransferase
MLLNEISLKRLKTHLEYHDTLNPALWDKDMKLHSDVKEALEKVANSFLTVLKVSKEEVMEIFVTGSNANYNWSRMSDIDLHVIVDYDKVCKDCESNNFNLDDCMKAKKTVWNMGHDVTIKGSAVEVYVQPPTEFFSGNAGCFSLIQDDWIRKPTKEEKLVYDTKEIKIKAKSLMDEIDDIIKGSNTNEIIIKALQDKIKNMRKASISRGGEMSLENLVFKTLRNNGYMDKLYDLGNKLKDKDLSLK